MKTSREFGYAYAEWGHTEKQDGFDGPVDVNAMLGGSVDIPEGDYRAMRNAKIEPDARQYWDGYNSYFTSLGAGMMGRKGGKSRSDAKAAAARENGKRGGRPRKETIVEFNGERCAWIGAWPAKRNSKILIAVLAGTSHSGVVEVGAEYLGTHNDKYGTAYDWYRLPNGARLV